MGPSIQEGKGNQETRIFLMRYKNGLIWLMAMQHRNLGVMNKIATVNPTAMNITTVTVLVERKEQDCHH
jgi:hypothetical protein